MSQSIRHWEHDFYWLHSIFASFYKSLSNSRVRYFHCFQVSTIIKNIKMCRNMGPNIHCSTVCNSQDMEATWIPIYRMGKENLVHLYSGMLLSHQKEWNDVICSHMDEPDYHTKWNRSGKERQKPYDITFMSNFLKMMQMKLLTKQEQTHRLRP